MAAVAGKGDVMEDTEKPEEGLADEAGIGDDKNGEVEKKEIPTEEPKAMDVDAPAVKPDIEVPAPEETKEVTTEKLTADTDDTKEAVPHGTNAVQPIGETEEPPKAPAVDEKAVDSELVGQPETEESVKQQDSVAMNEGEEEANGLELDTASIKTKEVDPPQPQGLHALVDNTTTIGGGPQPHEEAAGAIVEPTSLST